MSLNFWVADFLNCPEGKKFYIELVCLKLFKFQKRKGHMARLHVYPDGFEGVPEEIAANITGQIEPVKHVPKKLDEFSAEEIENFPKLWDYPEEYVVK